MSNRMRLAVVAGSLSLMLVPAGALAAIPDNNLLNAIVDEYRYKTAAWTPVLRNLALALFWILAVIEIAWTGIMLSLRGADLQEFGSELIQRVLFIGFFLALLLHSDVWSQAIVESFLKAAGQATAAAGGTPGISPATIFDIGLDLASRIVDAVSFLDLSEVIALVFGALIILICFALIAAFLLVTLVEMYLVVNGGVILLGFGATRWTSDFAQKYVVYAFSVGVKLFVMQLLIGLGEAFIRDWAVSFEEENSQVLVLIGAALVMLVMVARIPDIVAGLINGVTFSAGAGELKSTANTVGSLGGAAGGAARMVGGSASSATGHGLAARAAANLASAADPRGFGRMGAAFRHYANAFGDDLAGQFSGDPGRAYGKRGWRIRRDLQQRREALESEAGNTIGPGGSPDKGGDSSHPAPATGAEHGGRDDGQVPSVPNPAWTVAQQRMRDAVSARNKARRPAQSANARRSTTSGRHKPMAMVRLEKNDSEQTAPGLNPYLAARREWNERYGSYIARARRWRFMAFLSLVVAGIAVAGIVTIGAQRKVIPYVVEVDRLGRSAAVHYANRLQPADPRVIRALLARFIKDWRGVRVDAGAQKQAVLDLYALLSNSDPAATAISQYFQTDGNSPFERAKDETVAAEVVSVMPLTDQSWEIEWIEITRSRKGDVVGRQRWKAVMGIVINPPTDEATLLRNPIGMYVRELSWTKELGDPNEGLADVRN